MAATPLGHLGELTPRLAKVLAGPAHLYAEDTRRARILLTHLSLRRPVTPLHAHNERAQTAALLARLAAGDDCVLMTDAGTPAISDPGAQVAAAAHRAGLRVAALAGPSALAVALSVAGFVHAPHGSWFAGFLPTTPAARARQVSALLHFGGSSVVFESPRRIANLVAALARQAPAREAVLCRELTKMHEEVRRRPLAVLAQELTDTPARGEITLVVGPASTVEAAAEAGAGAAGNASVEASAAPGAGGAGLAAAAPDDGALRGALGRCRAQGMRPSEAARMVALVLGVPRGRIYKLAQDEAARSG